MPFATLAWVGQEANAIFEPLSSDGSQYAGYLCSQTCIRRVGVDRWTSVCISNCDYEECRCKGYNAVACRILAGGDGVTGRLCKSRLLLQSAGSTNCTKDLSTLVCRQL